MSSIKGVIFDLDGVILSTDNLHYMAWQKMADKEGISFNREINERLRGVSRVESLKIIMEKASRPYSDQEKLDLMEYKNNIYRESLSELSEKDIFPGVMDFISYLQGRNIKIAIGSSSKNSKTILKCIGLYETFDGAISDGTNISKSKPDPEVFLKAAGMMGLQPETCLVIEDADAGVEAGKRANMPVLGVGYAMNNSDADYTAPDIEHFDISLLPLD
jgi:beta-phosphoglucomutase